jgi:mevalonate pyrophosphate decarboxylase
MTSGWFLQQVVHEMKQSSTRSLNGPFGIWKSSFLKTRSLSEIQIQDNALLMVMVFATVVVVTRIA